MLINEPTVDDYKAWARLDDTIDDDALVEGLATAVAYQTRHYRFPDPTTYPQDLRQAALLRTSRYLARRNSPEGVVGFADYGPVAVGSLDRDVRDLEAPYAKPSVA